MLFHSGDEHAEDAPGDEAEDGGGELFVLFEEVGMDADVGH